MADEPPMTDAEWEPFARVTGIEPPSDSRPPAPEGLDERLAATMRAIGTPSPIEPPFNTLVLVGDYSDGPVAYTITAATTDGVPVEPDLADLFDLVLDRLGGSPCDDGDIE